MLALQKWGTSRLTIDSACLFLQTEGGLDDKANCLTGGSAICCLLDQLGTDAATRLRLLPYVPFRWLTSWLSMPSCVCRFISALML